MITFSAFNSLKGPEAQALLSACCGSVRWVNAMLDAMPFTSEVHMLELAEEIWYQQCGRKDWVEAFSHHPKIGDIDSLKEKFASTAHLAGNEQAGMAKADDALFTQLAAANKVYEEKHGFIFIVCATGKSAEEMLRLINERLDNLTEEELRIALGEQHKITLIRIKNSIQADWSCMKPGQLTVHMLDTSTGKPAAGVTVRLQDQHSGFLTLTQAVTNQDGRISDLLPPMRRLGPGVYKMIFETATYFKGQGKQSFYPFVEVSFEIFDNSHYHIPLLLSPFGYSTYRGS
jgi:5-hydroxyisourate hydrolase/2-oxo-4-hydroxy-4-carboxy-5-ureidoimidazoline decarboxylase